MRTIIKQAYLPYPPIEGCEELADLALSRYQLGSLQSYYAVHYKYAKQQRFAFLAMAGAVLTAWLLPLVLHTDDSVPFTGAADWVVQWLPLIAVFLAITQVGVAVRAQNRADKLLPEIGLSAEAVQRVRDIAMALNRSVIFHGQNLDPRPRKSK